jgi:2-dehydro-3-deoxygluconokinase
MTGRLVTLGETLGVIATTEPGPVASGSGARLGIAGSESNVAIGVTRLGCRATWIGRVGGDPFGRLVARELRAEGVDARIVLDQRPTGTLLREQRTTGLARTTYYRSGSAGSRLSPEDVADDVLDTADLLHVTGITPALGDGPAAALARVVAMAVERGVRVSFDVNYRAALWSSEEAVVALEPLLGKADIVFAGQHEAALFCGPASPAALAKSLHETGGSMAVVTGGAAGSWVCGDGFELAQPAHRVRVVDTVGAGDAFVAGFLAELMAGHDAVHCLATATALGAFAVSTLGDWEGLPRRAELALLESVDEVLR